MNVFEDAGYFCVDNLPPGMIVRSLSAPGGSAIGTIVAHTADTRR
jgi:RNase adaptor protein for sRNA GlmZ degradation